MDSTENITIQEYLGMVKFNIESMPEGELRDGLIEHWSVVQAQLKHLNTCYELESATKQEGDCATGTISGE